MRYHPPFSCINIGQRGKMQCNDKSESTIHGSVLLALLGVKAILNE